MKKLWKKRLLQVDGDIFTVGECVLTFCGFCGLLAIIYLLN